VGVVAMRGGGRAGKGEFGVGLAVKGDGLRDAEGGLNFSRKIGAVKGVFVLILNTNLIKYEHAFYGD
jgi:hypothetical protein